MSKYITISLSSPVVTKNRCKKCCSIPSTLIISHNNIFRYSKNLDSRYKILGNYFIKIPSFFYLLPDEHLSELSLINFKTSTSFKSFIPKKFNSTLKDLNDNFYWFLICKCGESFWSVNSIYNKFRPECENRKSHKKFTHHRILAM